MRHHAADFLRRLFLYGPPTTMQVEKARKVPQTARRKPCATHETRRKGHCDDVVVGKADDRTWGCPRAGDSVALAKQTQQRTSTITIRSKGSSAEFPIRTPSALRLEVVGVLVRHARQ